MLMLCIGRNIWTKTAFGDMGRLVTTMLHCCIVAAFAGLLSISRWVDDTDVREDIPKEPKVYNLCCRLSCPSMTAVSATTKILTLHCPPHHPYSVRTLPLSLHCPVNARTSHHHHYHHPHHHHHRHYRHHQTGPSVQPRSDEGDGAVRWSATARLPRAWIPAVSRLLQNTSLSHSPPCDNFYFNETRQAFFYRVCFIFIGTKDRDDGVSSLVSCAALYYSYYSCTAKWNRRWCAAKHLGAPTSRNTFFFIVVMFFLCAVVVDSKYRLGLAL